MQNRALCFTRYSGNICAVRWKILPPDNFYDRWQTACQKLLKSTELGRSYSPPKLARFFWTTVYIPNTKRMHVLKLCNCNFCWWHVGRYFLHWWHDCAILSPIKRATGVKSTLNGVQTTGRQDVWAKYVWATPAEWLGDSIGWQQKPCTLLSTTRK